MDIWQRARSAWRRLPRFSRGSESGTVRASMQRRIIISILASVLFITASLGVVSYLHIRDSIRQSSQDRLTEAKIIAATVDGLLERNLTRLYDVSLSDKIDLRDGDWSPEREALRAAYEYSIFTDGVFLLDKLGNVILTYPPREGWSVNLLGIPPVSRVATELRPVISNVHSMEPTRRKVIFALVPLRNRVGEVEGTAGGLIDPTNYHFIRVIKSLPADEDATVDLVDGLGIVISSNNPGNVLTGIDHNKFLSSLIRRKEAVVATCHRCHDEDRGDRPRKTEDILAFAPVGIAPWGVALRVSKDVMTQPADALKRGFIVLAVVSLCTAFVLSFGMSRSIVKPVRQLIRATERIAGGKLDEPLDVGGADEIGALSRSFDNMRVKLAASLDSIQRQNVFLEERVRLRTRQLEEKQRINTVLLKRLIGSQEDERKRIARELHDESLQTLAAILMNIDMCRLHPESITQDKVLMIEDMVTQIINETNKLIQNLRPTVLDDLGFEAAIGWLAERNLRDRGIECLVTMTECREEDLPPEHQITLFRVIQEATYNIARHAKASRTFIYVRNDRHRFEMTIEDDGEGFDTSGVFENTMTGRGLGILGMKERVGQINGTLRVCSAPGAGTMVLCTVPLGKEV